MFVGLAGCPHARASGPALPGHHHASHQGSLKLPLASSISGSLKDSAAPLPGVTVFDVTIRWPAWAWDALVGSTPLGPLPTPGMPLILPWAEAGTLPPAPPLAWKGIDQFGFCS